MHDFVALDPSPSLRGGSKTNRSGRAGNLSRLARSNRVAWPLQVGGDNALVQGAGGFSCTPAVARTGVGSAHGVGKTLGGRAVEKCAVGTHFKVLGLQGTEPALCQPYGCLVIGGRMSAVSLKLPHAPCAPLS